MPRPKKLTPDNLALPEAIRQMAWKQMAETGAAGLSLRAIARALGVTAPAIYNYYPRRDDLVTALIVEAYTGLADSQHRALAGQPLADPLACLLALGRDYRAWAVGHPQHYQLIFGTPIPGYVAPADITQPAAAQALTPLITALQAAHTAGRLRVERLAPAEPSLRAGLAAWRQAADGAEPEALYLALSIWSRVHGLVMLEIGAQLPGFFSEPGAVFERELQTLAAQYL